MTDDGRTVVETRWGTYYTVSPQGTMEALPLRTFDPVRWDVQRSSLASRVPDLQADEASWLAETYGTSLRGVFPAPGGRFALLQVDGNEGRLENLLWQRESGQRVSLGSGQNGASWSPDGRFVALTLEDGPHVIRGTQERKRVPRSVQDATWSEDGRSLRFPDGQTIPLSQLFSAWDVDLGQSQALPIPLSREEDAIVIGGMKLPRRTR
jgi:hypothetical protein